MRDRSLRAVLRQDLRQPVPGWERPVPERVFCKKGLRDRSLAGETGSRTHEVLVLVTDLYACLSLCSFAHACEGRSLQAGTQELAIAIRSPCGFGRRSGLPWERLIPRMGMLTITGPLGTVKLDSLRVGLMPDSLRVGLIRAEL
uniref:Uncharacterized protein n=1 Tax=Ananas comosus var. bracteatus TaxID=296719 RepID=A0A6V7Q2I8_ANACO|nr:unnamed protein product [Ananas comosus var. bracteatus]